MVFVHGGAFVKGSSSPSEYRPDFLIEKDVILVTLNYRYREVSYKKVEIYFLSFQKKNIIVLELES